MNNQVNAFISQVNNKSLLSHDKSVVKVSYSKENLILSKYLYTEGLVSSFQVIHNDILLNINSLFRGRKLIKKISNKKVNNALKFKDIVYLRSLNSSLIVSCNKGGYKSVEYLKKNKTGGIPVYKLI